MFLHMCVILFTGGGLGLCPGGGSVQGVSVQGVSVQGGIHPRKSLSRGVSIQVSLCPGGLCPRGFCPGGSLSRGSLSKGSLSR